MKFFANAKDIIKSVKFFVCYHPVANHLSFIASSSGECWIGFPCLAPGAVNFQEQRGHQSGVRIFSYESSLSLQNVFTKMLEHTEWVEEVSVPAEQTDEAWNILQSRMLAKLHLAHQSSGSPISE